MFFVEELLNQYRGLQASGFGCCGFGSCEDFINHPKVAGAAGVAAVYTEMIKLFIFSGISQAVMGEIAHFWIRQEKTEGHITFMGDVCVVKGVHAILS